MLDENCTIKVSEAALHPSAGVYFISENKKSFINAIKDFFDCIMLFDLNITKYNTRFVSLIRRDKSFIAFPEIERKTHNLK